MLIFVCGPLHELCHACFRVAGDKGSDTEFRGESLREVEHGVHRFIVVIGAVAFDEAGVRHVEKAAETRAEVQRRFVAERVDEVCDRCRDIVRQVFPDVVRDPVGAVFQLEGIES